MTVQAPSTASTLAPAGHPDRRTDLDWLRIAAFGFLILYHVGMFYVTWDWHVKSSHASEAVEPLMLMLNPWRLTLLFIISGAATRYMFDKMRPAAFLGARTARLLPPLIFGMFVIVPPQTYFQVVDSLGYSGSFSEFYARYATASGHWTINGDPLITPTWNHLWFVAYLFVYTLIAMLVGPLLKRIPARFARPLIAGPLILLTPIAFLTAMRIWLFPSFPETNALVGDWYNHAVSLTAFLFGYAIAKHEPFFVASERLRWLGLVLALAGWISCLAIYVGLGSSLEKASRVALLAMAREVQAWCAIIACVGFARRHLRHDGPIRRYLTDAIFPFYIIHQTTIVVAGVLLDRQHLPLAVEAPLLIAITVASCWVGYEIVRRIPPLRPQFGLKLAAQTSVLAAKAGSTA